MRCPGDPERADGPARSGRQLRQRATPAGTLHDKPVEGERRPPVVICFFIVLVLRAPRDERPISGGCAGPRKPVTGHLSKPNG